MPSERKGDNHQQSEGDPADPILALERNRDEAGEPQARRQRGQGSHGGEKDSAEAEAAIDVVHRQAARGYAGSSRRDRAAAGEIVVELDLLGDIVRLEDAGLSRRRRIVLERHAR